MVVRQGMGRGRWASVVAVAVVVAACGGGDGDDTSSTDPVDDTSVATAADEDVDATVPDGDAEAGDDTDSGDASGDAAGEDATGGGAATGSSFVEIDGERFEFTSAIECTIGDSASGPDFRSISLENDGDFPAVLVTYVPDSDTDSGRVNVAALFPSTDPWWYTTDAAGVDDFDAMPTPDGVVGTATVGVAGDGGPEGEFVATFELSCDDDGSGTGAADEPADSGSSGADSSSGSSAQAPDTDTGTVVLAGETFELTGPSRSDVLIDPSLGDTSDDFDFEICETVNPAFEGDFNIAGTLGDGTPFRLSGNVDRAFDDFDGLFLGDTFDEEGAENTVVALDGRTLSGTATTSRGDIEFTFTC